MSTAARTEPRVERAEVTDEWITFWLEGNRRISIPTWWSWRLEQATPEQRARYEIIGSGVGIHWPDVDEDLSVWGMFYGSPAGRPKPKSS